MKPANFPSRVDKRRQEAAERAKKAGDEVTYNNTIAKLNTYARGLRTKKRRVGMAKI